MMNRIRKVLSMRIMSILLIVILMTACNNQTGQGGKTPSQSNGTNTTEGSAGNATGSPAQSPTETSLIPPIATASVTPEGTNATNATNAAQSVPANISMGKVTAVRLIDQASGWVGGIGWIAKTVDSGRNWNVQYEGVQTVEQLFALNGRDAWAVLGDDSDDQTAWSLLQTTDGGGSWTVIGNLPNKGFLHFTSMTDAYEANARSDNGGKTWVNVAVPSGHVGDAYFHDQDHGWVVVESKSTVGSNNRIEVQRTLNGGKTWQTVMSRKDAGQLNGTVIRSAGINDAWIECIGDSGMSQTSYSLFHTMDGGGHWQTVIANTTAGAGPAPGFTMEDNNLPNNAGSKPGPLDVVSPDVAFMGGYCPACDDANTIGWTTDGGKTWHNSKEKYAGYGGAYLAMADAKNGWWICTDYADPSVMYITSNGGVHWQKTYTFDLPKQR